MRASVHGIHPPRVVALVALAVVSAGCAAAAGAGALGVIAYNERGAEVNLETTIESASAATEAVFAELSITTTSRESQEGEAEIEYQGHAGDMEVVVEIEEEGGAVELEVTAREGMLGYAPEYAEDVLKRIMSRL